jgi:hypothetical protein
MNASLCLVLTSTSAIFALMRDILNFGSDTVTFPITQSNTSKLYIFLSEVLNYPGPITDEHLATISDKCFQGKNSVHDMMDQLNEKFNGFLDDLKQRGKVEKKEAHYQAIIDAILSSQTEGRINFVVKGKKSDGDLNDQIFLTIPTTFYSAVPHLRGTYTPPNYLNPSATAEVTIIS